MPSDARQVRIEPATFPALIATAGRAPSLHNSQPWRFRLIEPGTIELEVAKDRVLPHIDPVGREAVISCGAALHNLLLALRARGLRGTVRRSPEPGRPLVLASVVVEPGSVPTADERRAIAAIYRRHTHRTGFDAPLSDQQLRTALDAAVEAAGCGLVWVTDHHRREGLISIARAALAHERLTPQLARDTTTSVSLDDSRRDGVPRRAMAAQRLHEPAETGLPDRFLTERRHAAEPGVAGVIAVLVTNGDGLGDWLAAGQAMQGLLLRAAEDWAFARLASSALERPGYRQAVRSLLDTADYPQMIFELGHSRITATTPRFDPEELLVDQR